MSRVDAYIEAFTGVAPTEAELKRFFARHPGGECHASGIPANASWPEWWSTSFEAVSMTPDVPHSSAVRIGFVAKLVREDSLSESGAVGGSDAQASQARIPHDELERL